LRTVLKAEKDLSKEKLFDLEELNI